MTIGVCLWEMVIAEVLRDEYSAAGNNQQTRRGMMGIRKIEVDAELIRTFSTRRQGKRKSGRDAIRKKTKSKGEKVKIRHVPMIALISGIFTRSLNFAALPSLTAL